MANWCDNKFAIYTTRKEDEPLIIKGYLKLRDVLKCDGADCTGYGRKVLQDFGCDEETSMSIDGRSTIYQMELDKVTYDSKEITFLSLRIESAWEPCTGFIDTLLEILYGDKFTEEGLVGYKYIAEEPGNELFVNTDVAHIFFKEVLRIEYVSDDDIETNYYEDTEEDKKKVIEDIDRLTGYKLHDMKDLHNPAIRRYITELVEKSGDGGSSYMTINFFEEE